MYRGLERLLHRQETAWVVLVASVIMTLMAWHVSSRYLEQETRQRFEKSVQQSSIDIEKRMISYGEVLRAGAGLFKSSEHVTRDEWRLFVQELQLDRTYPGILGLGYAVMVPEAGKAALEKSFQVEGFPDFRIVPAGSRALYSAIVYLEPFDARNRRAFGYDMYSEPVRRAAMQRACDTGQVALSGHVRLLQEGGEDIQQGMLMYIPIYRTGLPIGTLAERRTALAGFVYGVFRAGDLMRGILGERPKLLDFALYDGSPTPDNLIFQADAASGVARPKAAARFREDVEFEIAGRQWTGRFASGPAFEAEVRSIQPGLIALGGILADGLLFAALFSISRSHKRLARSNARLAASREALAEERSRFARLVENLPGVVFRCAIDPPWPVRFVSQRIENITGIPADDFIQGRIDFGDLIHPDDLDGMRRDIAAAVAAGLPFEIQYRSRYLTGGWRWMVSRGHAQYEGDGKPAWLDGVAFDITERKQQEQEAVERELRYRAVIETATDGFWLADDSGRLLIVNEAYARMSGYSQDELRGLRIQDLDAEECPEDTAAHIRKVFEQGRDRFETRHRRKDGSIWPAEVTVSRLSTLDEMFVFIRDLTEIKAYEAERANSVERMRQLAFYDPLTGLPNRRLLADRLKQSLAASQRNGLPGALLFLDMDNFKHLNDSLGHEMGDLLLIEVARRLKACVREADTVARLGGDEFVVMLPELASTMDESIGMVRAVGEKVLAVLNRSYQLGEHPYHSTPSIGATVFQGDGDDVDAILRRADAAMYQVKAAGRNALRFFDAGMDKMVSEQALLDACLHAETPDNALVLHYQPVLDEAGRVVGAEALVRWHHPERGMLLPGRFLGMAEDSGLIVLLGRRVLEKACRQLAGWAGKPAMAGLDLSVNISTRHFMQPGFVDEVMAILDASGADPRRLVFELNERLLLQDCPLPLEAMQTLRARGIRFSLDNFGACYLSQGATLDRLPIDQLKLAIDAMTGGSADAARTALLDALLVLGRQLNSEVVAKGVENAAQWDLLRGHGWQRVQGYLFGAAEPAEVFERYCSRE